MSNELAVQTPRPHASTQLAAFIGMEQAMMIDTIRAQCFKGDASKISDEQVAAFISIACDMKVNPLLPGMLYAYPSQGAIVPIMGPDGVFKKLAEHPDVVSWEVEVLPVDVLVPPTHAIAKIYRKGIDRPVIYTALLSEWKVGSNPNWNSRPRHMLQLRAIKHAARQVIHGLPYDEDDCHIMQEVNVTHTGEAPSTIPAEQRPDPSTVRRGLGRPKGSGIAASKDTAIDVTSTSAAEQKPAADPVASDKPAAGPDVKKAPISRTSIEKGEKLNVAVKIVSANYEDFGPAGAAKHGCQAIVSGEFNGKVFDLNGGHLIAGAEGLKGAVLPIWQSKGTIMIELSGKKSSLGVIAVVEKVSASPEAEKAPSGLGVE